MKKILMVLLTLTMVFGLAACGSTDDSSIQAESDTTPQIEESQEEEDVTPQIEEPQADEELNILVACISPYAETVQVANEIATQTGGLYARIEVANYYSDDFDTALAEVMDDLQNANRPELITTIENMDEYDVIFVGYPIYAETAYVAALSFLEAYDLDGKTIVPFCTSASGGAYTSATDIANDLAAIGSTATVTEPFSIAISADVEVDLEGEIATWLDYINVTE